jgi:hypothetical protein
MFRRYTFVFVYENTPGEQGKSEAEANFSLVPPGYSAVQTLRGSPCRSTNPFRISTYKMAARGLVELARHAKFPPALAAYTGAM